MAKASDLTSQHRDNVYIHLRQPKRQIEQKYIYRYLRYAKTPDRTEINLQISQIYQNARSNKDTSADLSYSQYARSNKDNVYRYLIQPIRQIEQRYVYRYLIQPKRQFEKRYAYRYLTQPKHQIRHLSIEICLQTFHTDTKTDISIDVSRSQNARLDMF